MKIKLRLSLQEYLDNKYPTKEEREKVRFVGIESNNEVDEEIRVMSGLEGIWKQPQLQHITEDVEEEDLEFEDEKLDLREYPKVCEVHLPSLSLTELILGKKAELDYLECKGNKLTRLDLSGCPNLVKFYCDNNPLVSLIYPNNNPQKWIETVWQEVKSENKTDDRGKFSILDKLINNSDLNKWIANCDFRTNDEEYYKLCENDEKHSCCDFKTIKSLGKKIMFRRLVVFYRSLKPTEYLNIDQYKFCEEEVRKVLEGDYFSVSKFRNSPCYEKWIENEFEKCFRAINKKRREELEQIKAKEIVNEVLSGDMELLARLQDLPYLMYQLPSTKIFRQSIKNLEEKNSQLEAELVLEREEAEKMQKQMDKFYRQNITGLKDILKDFSFDVLQLNVENKRLKEENEKLRKELELEEEFKDLKINQILIEKK